MIRRDWSFSCYTCDQVMGALSTRTRLLLVLMLGVLGCRADYTFIQTYHSYLNPRHIRANEQCCDEQQRSFCSAVCDNVFTVCVQLTDQTLPDVGNIQHEDCPMGLFVSPTYDNNDNITFNTSVPVIFTGDIWPASFKLLVQVSDADTGNPDDFIDILVVERPFSPSLSPSPPTNYTSSARVFSLVMSFRVECSENFYGEDCSVFCEPHDDDSLGHFICGSAGERVCLEGYQNPDSNCTECTPAEGCLNGYCDEPGDCLCHEGHGGELCTQDLLSEGSGGRSGEQSHDRHVTYIVVGVLVGVGVTVVTVVLVWKRKAVKKIKQGFKKSTTLMPGDNPIYMSADLIGHLPSVQSPAHNVAVETSGPALHELAVSDSILARRDPGDSILARRNPGDSILARRDPGDSILARGDPGDSILAKEDLGDSMFDDDMYSCSKPLTTVYTPGFIDPYGDYSDKTITQIAMAPSPPLLDDSTHDPEPTADTDVDSDYQSEFL